jgi:hypothetical protein
VKLYGLHVAVVLTGIGLTLAACSETPPTAPRNLGLAAKPAPIDVSGTWNWSEEGKGLIPEEAVVFFGIQPEGKATHFTCHNFGILVLSQDGTAFEGFFTQEGTCTTRGGQVFDNTFPEPVFGVAGTVHGSSITFDFGDPICPYQAVLEVEEGTAIAMDGTGRCGPFGPRNHAKTVTFEATRAGS